MDTKIKKVKNEMYEKNYILNWKYNKKKNWNKHYYKLIIELI